MRINVQKLKWNLYQVQLYGDDDKPLFSESAELLSERKRRRLMARLHRGDDEAQPGLRGYPPGERLEIMDLVTAQKLAGEVMVEIRPFCARLEVAGSIRRKRPFPRDIDIVCVPGNQGQCALKLKELGCHYGAGKLARFFWKGTQVDLYLATPQTWATLLLIRTGSARNNVPWRGPKGGSSMPTVMDYSMRKASGWLGTRKSLSTPPWG